MASLVDALLQHRWAERVVDSSSLAALTFLVWDTFTSLDEEVEWIWSKPRTSWIKWIFLYSRYFAILTLLTEVIGDRIRGSIMSCPAWYGWQGVALQFLLAGVDVLLMARVYALYNRSLVIVRVMTFLWICAQGAMSWSLATSIPSFKYSRRCVLLETPPDLLLFAIASLIFQSTLFFLTAYKFILAARAGWGRTALIALLMRDGTWAYVLVFCVIVVHHVFAIALDDGLNSIAYSWMISLSSFSGCRLVLNMYALPDPTDADDPLSRFRPRVREIRRRERQVPRMDAAAYFTTMGQGMMLTTVGPAFTTRFDLEPLNDVSAYLNDQENFRRDLGAGPSSLRTDSGVTLPTLVDHRYHGRRAKDIDDMASMVFSSRRTYATALDEDTEEYELSTAVGSGAPSLTSHGKRSEPSVSRYPV